MNVLIYVEGRSYVLAMQALLQGLIETKAAKGVAIRFFECPSGDKKESAVRRVPEKAVDILRNDSDAIVAVAPDLYPLDKGCPHATPSELYAGIRANFDAVCQRKGIDAIRLGKRFHTFCLKYDLEALVLASADALAPRLGVNQLGTSWKIPVEDQNGTRYPRLIVEELFRAHGKTYRNTVDAPLILGKVGVAHLEVACPQCFGPFVEFLRSL